MRRSQGLAAPAWRSDWALFFITGSVLFPCREFDGCWVHFRPRFVQPRGDGLARCLPRQETHQSFKGRGRASCLQQWCCLGPEWISGRVGGHERSRMAASCGIGAFRPSRGPLAASPLPGSYDHFGLRCRSRGPNRCQARLIVTSLLPNFPAAAWTISSIRIFFLPLSVLCRPLPTPSP